MSQSPLWFVVFLLTKFIYNPVGFLFQHRDPGSTRTWNQKFSLPAQRSGIYQDMESEVFSSSTETRIYQDVESEVFSSSTETRICQDVESGVFSTRTWKSEVSSPAQRPGSARTWNQKCPHQHRGPGLPGRGLRSRQVSPA